MKKRKFALKKSCQSVSQQSHTARKQEASRVKIYYRFHPRHGEELNVLYCKRFRGEQYYIVEQLDLTYALLPVWMTQPAASCYQLHTEIHISLSALLELQNFIKVYHETSNNSVTQPLGVHDEKTSRKSKATARAISLSSSGSEGQSISANKRKGRRDIETINDRDMEAKPRRSKK